MVVPTTVRFEPDDAKTFPTLAVITQTSLMGTKMFPLYGEVMGEEAEHTL